MRTIFYRRIPLISVVSVLFLVTMLWANPISPSWRLINNSAPYRYGHKCAYDIARNVVVLFGGEDPNDNMPGGVWEFTGDMHWIENQAPGPAGRIGHGLCYDSAAQVTILFGGENQAGQYLNDTWSWNGTVWTRIDSTGPSPRAFFAFAYDNQRQRVVLFGGGANDSLYGDTWEWDGNIWQQRATIGPPPRVSTAMAFDDAYEYPHNPIGKCYLFGGQAGFDGPALNDTWVWDGASWAQIHPEVAPSHRVGHAMADGGVLGSVTLFGGQNTGFPDSVFGDTWELTAGLDSNWYDCYWFQFKPPARSLTSMVSFNDQIMLFGGTDWTQFFHDVWICPVWSDYYTMGDVNCNNNFNMLDIVYAINYFRGGSPPPYSYECPPGHTWYITGDVNASCTFNGVDVTYMVNYFKGGPVFYPCPDCPPGR